MSVISMKQLLEAGVHFGHQTRRWNPKMAEYIFTERNDIYIIDLQKTVKKIDEAYNFMRDVSASGAPILFVGTKKQAQESIQAEAERCDMYFVNHRWLGGADQLQDHPEPIWEAQADRKDGSRGQEGPLPKKEVGKLMKIKESLRTTWAASPR